jgi:hypothetical protein
VQVCYLPWFCHSPVGMDPFELMIDCYDFTFFFNASVQRDVKSESNLPRVPSVLIHFLSARNLYILEATILLELHM